MNPEPGHRAESIPAKRHFEEHRLDLAARAIVEGRRHCGACRSYHTIWPMRRLTNLGYGIDKDAPLIEPLMDEAMSTGERRRVLIAGCADSGLLAFILQTAHGRPLDILAIDVCETPLALCRAHAADIGVPIRTRRQSLLDLADHGIADIVLAHSVLSHVGAGNRDRAFAAIANALAPDGVLFLTTLVAPREPGMRRPVDMHSVVREAGLGDLIGEAELQELLDDWNTRATDPSPFNSIEELEAATRALGLVVEQVVLREKRVRVFADSDRRAMPPSVILVARRPASA